MYKSNYVKKIIIFLLLYTILITNSSIFSIYGNDLNDSLNTSETESNIQQPEVPILDLVAESAVLIDAKTGIVLYNKNMNEKVFPASTTKILTAALAIEKTKPTDTLTFSHNAVYNIGPDSSNIGMKENEKISVGDALYGVMLNSANEVCMALAEHISGSVENFVNLMNQKVQQIGAKNTHFANPHGYHDENHYTTSYDMALIMKEALKHEEFVRLISTRTHTIPPTDISPERNLINSNKLILKNSPFYYEYAVGGKTGFTNEAGNTLVSYAKKDDLELIAVIMKGNRTTIYEDSKKLYDYGFSLYSTKEIFNKSDYSSNVNAIQKFNEKDIALGKVPVSAKSSISMSVPNTLDLTKLTTKVTLPKNVYAPLNANDKVGNIDIMYENNKISSVDIVSDATIETIPESSLQKKENIKNTISTTLKVLKYSVIGLISFFALFFLSAFISRNIFKIIRKRRRRKLRFSSNKSKYKYKPKRPKRRSRRRY